MSPTLPSRIALSTRSLAKRAFGARCQSTATAAADNGDQLLQSHADWDNFRAKKAQVRTLIDVFSEYGSTQTTKNTFQPRDSLHKPPRNATISALLASGAHFGHASSRMNPNFTPYAYGTRAGITIIDLDSTLPLLRRAANVTRAVARAGGQIVFIGTRPDLKPVVQKAAERVGSQQGFYIGERWLPGTLTNRRQFFNSDELSSLKIIPDLAIILNPIQNANAIREFAIENVPTIGIIDSNVDPRLVLYPIPANDENTRTAELVAGVLSIAAREGVDIRAQEERAREESKSRQSHRESEESE